MKQERNIARVVKKIPLSEEGNDVLDWLQVSFEKKMESLERMRNFFEKINGRVYPSKMEKKLTAKT